MQDEKETQSTTLLKHIFPCTYDSIRKKYTAKTREPNHALIYGLWGNLLTSFSKTYGQGKSIFISYAWASKPYKQFNFDQYKRYEFYIEKIVEDLKKAGFEVYLDRWNDAGNKNFVEDVQEHIRKADAYLIMMSPLYLHKFLKRVDDESASEHVVKMEAIVLNQISVRSTLQRKKMFPLFLEKMAHNLELLALVNRGYWPEEGASSLLDSSYFAMMFELLADLNNQVDKRGLQWKALERQFYSDIANAHFTEDEAIRFKENQAKRESIEKSEQDQRIASAKGLLLQVPKPNNEHIQKNPQRDLLGLPPAFSDFTGRGKELLQLKSTQTQVITEKVCHLAGSGGIGKSQLANHYARAQYKAGYYDWVLWWRVGTEDPDQILAVLELQWRETERKLGIDSGHKEKALLERIYQSLSKRGQGLVILDDVMSYQSIKGILPEAYEHHGMDVLLTSLNTQKWGVKQIELSVFQLKDAVQYIEKVLKFHSFQCTNARRLAKTLGCYPLAISQAIAYLVQEGETIDGYCDEYIATKANRKALLDEKVFENDEHQTTIWVTLQLSLQKLTTPAQALLNRLSYLAPETPIDKKLLQIIDKSKKEVRLAIRELSRYGLLGSSDRAGAPRIHEMVQRVTRLAHSVDTKKQMLLKLGEGINTYLNEKELKPLEEERRETESLPHVESVASHIKGAKDKESQLRYAVLCHNVGGVYKYTLGQPKAALVQFQTALAIQESHFGKSHVQVASTLYNLGNTYGELGNASGAKRFLERALAIKKSYYGELHWQVANSLHNLGSAYGELGDAREKKRLLERALAIKESHYGKSHWQVAITLHDLGGVYGELGDASEAKRLLERALAIKESHYGKSHWRVAKILLYLSIATGELGLLTEQTQHLNRALVIFKATSGNYINFIGLTCLLLAHHHGLMKNPESSAYWAEKALGHFAKVIINPFETILLSLVSLDYLDEKRSERVELLFALNQLIQEQSNYLYRLPKLCRYGWLGTTQQAMLHLNSFIKQIEPTNHWGAGIKERLLEAFKKEHQRMNVLQSQAPKASSHQLESDALHQSRDLLSIDTAFVKTQTLRTNVNLMAFGLTLLRSYTQPNPRVLYGNDLNLKHHPDYHGLWSDPIKDSDSKAYVFQYTAYDEVGSVVGHAKFYGHKGLCFDESKTQHNVLELSGIYEGATVNLESQGVDTCVSLPPNVLERFVYHHGASVGFGVSRGVSNTVYVACQKLNYSNVISQSVRFNSYFIGVYMTQYFTSSSQRSTKQLFQSTSLLLIAHEGCTVAGDMLHQAGNKAKEAGWDWSGRVLGVMGECIKYTGFLWAGNSMGEMLTSMIIGSVAQAGTELIGGYVLSRFFKPATDSLKLENEAKVFDDLSV